MTTAEAFFVPGRRADTLYGRSGALQMLDKFVHGREHVCFIYGIGGTGKTALALELANGLTERQPSPLDMIVFMSARPSPWVIGSGPFHEDLVVKDTQQLFRKLAQALGRLHLTRMEPGEQFSELCDALKARGRVLLIIDNWETVEDSSLLGTLMSFPENVKSLITTRVLPDGPFQSLPLDPLDREEAVRFARDTLRAAAHFQGGEADIDTASHDLARLCGNVPLAMSLAFPHVVNLDSLNDLATELSTMSVGAEGDEALCTIVSGYSCKQLKRRYPRAYQALEVLAVLPQPIPKDDLRDIVQRMTGNLLNITEFNHFRLLEKRNDGLCSLHSLVRTHVGLTLQEDAKRSAEVMDHLISFYANLSASLVGNPRIATGRFGEYKRLEPRAENIFHVIRWCDANGRSADVLRLVADLGYLFRVSEYWTDGEQLWAMAASAADAGGDRDEAFRFSMYVVYLRLFRGRKVRAEVVEELYVRYYGLLRTSLAFRRSYNRASFLRLLGLVGFSRGHFEDAYRFLSASVHIMEQIGSQHGRCRLYNDLADLLMYCDQVRAEDLLLRNLKTSRDCEDSIEEVRALRLLGDCRAYGGGRDDEALGWYREAMERSKDVGLPDERYCARRGMRLLRAQSPSTSGDDEAAEREFASLQDWIESRPPTMPSRILRCIVLDWSGVLANDLSITEACQRRTLERFAGVMMSSEQWRREATMTWRQFLRDRIADDDRCEQAFAYYEQILAIQADDVRLVEGADETLAWLAARGFRIVIYTSQLAGVVERCIDRLGIQRYIDSVVHAGEVGHNKPSALHLDSICKELGLSPTEVVVVDDMEDTIEVARAFGCMTVGCRSILARDLRRADRTIDGLAGLSKVLEEERIDPSRAEIASTIEPSDALVLASDVKGSVDFAIVTILEDEFEAVLRRFPKWVTADGQRRYRIRRLPLPSGGSYTIAVVRTIEQGNTEALDAARDVFEDLDPAWLLVVGIAGGAPANGFTLGDVIVSSRISDFSVEAVLEDHSRTYALGGGPLHPNAAKIVGDIRAMVQAGEIDGWASEEALGRKRPAIDLSDDKFYGDAGWIKDTREALIRHFAVGPPRQPIVTTGPIASSDRLIKDTEILQVWLWMQRKVAAVEMESAGAYRAAHGKGVPFLAIRGLSDVVGFKRNPDWTLYACEVAASFTRALLLTRPIAPRLARPLNLRPRRNEAVPRADRR